MVGGLMWLAGRDRHGSAKLVNTAYPELFGLLVHDFDRHSISSLPSLRSVALPNPYDDFTNSSSEDEGNEHQMSASRELSLSIAATSANSVDTGVVACEVGSNQFPGTVSNDDKDVMISGTLETADPNIREKHVDRDPLTCSTKEVSKDEVDSEDERRSSRQADRKSEMKQHYCEALAVSDMSMDCSNDEPNQSPLLILSPVRSRTRLEPRKTPPSEWVYEILRLLKANSKARFVSRDDEEFASVPRMEPVLVGTKGGDLKLLVEPSYRAAALASYAGSSGEDNSGPDKPLLVVWGYNGQLSKSRQHHPEYNSAVASVFQELGHICRCQEIPHVYLGDVKEKILSLFPDLATSPDRHNVIGVAVFCVMPDLEPELARIVEIAPTLYDMPRSDDEDVSARNVTATARSKPEARVATMQGKESRDLIPQRHVATSGLSGNGSTIQLSINDDEMNEKQVRGISNDDDAVLESQALTSTLSESAVTPNVDSHDQGNKTPEMWVRALFKQLLAYRRRVRVLDKKEKRCQSDTANGNGTRIGNLSEESSDAVIMPIQPSMEQRVLENLLARCHPLNLTSQDKDRKYVSTKSLLVVWGFDAQRHKDLQHPQINTSVAGQFQALDDICRRHSIPHIYMGDVGHSFSTFFFHLEPGHRSKVIGTAVFGVSPAFDETLGSVVLRASFLHELLSRNIPPLTLTKNQKKALSKAASNKVKAKSEHAEKRNKCDATLCDSVIQLPSRKKLRQITFTVDQHSESDHYKPLVPTQPTARPRTLLSNSSETRGFLTCGDVSSSFLQQLTAPPATLKDGDRFAQSLKSSRAKSLTVLPSRNSTEDVPASHLIETTGERMIDPDTADKAVLQPSGEDCASTNACDSSTGRAGMKSNPISSEGLIDEANLKFDLRRLRLEEEVKALYAALSSLSARNRTLADFLRYGESKLSGLQSKASPLHLRISVLEASSACQSSLYGKVSTALVKSRGSLARLLSSEDVSEQEMADLVASVSQSEAQVVLEESRVVEALEQGLSAESTSQAVTLRMPQHKLLEDPSLSLFADNVKTHRYRSIRSIYQLNDKKYLVPYSEVDDGSWLDFWKERNVDDKISGFFPCLRSKGVLNATLDISCREMIALDTRFFPSAEHRREVLGNTCLDARLIPAKPLKWKWRQSLAGASIASAAGINPSIALCPYELTGICADLYCQFQHLQERPTGCYLAREYLVLHPPLSVYRRVEAKSRNQDHSHPKMVRRNRRTKGEYTDLSACYDDVTRNNDFIGLPLAAVGEAIGLHKSSEKMIEECEPSNCWLWWNYQSTLHVEDHWYPDRSTSFSDVLKHYGCDLSGNNFTMETPLDVLAACLFCGRVTEATRLAIHTGRHDFAKSILAFSHDVVVIWGNRSSSLVTRFRATALKAMATLSNLQKLAFAFDSVPTKSSIRVAAESQMISAIVSFLFYYLFVTITENEGMFPHGDVDIWLEDMDIVLSLLDESTETRTSRSDSASDGWQKSLKESLKSKMLTHLVEDKINTPEIPFEVTSASSLIESYILPFWDKAKDLLATAANDQLIGSGYYVKLRVVLRTVNTVLCALEWAMASAADESSEVVVKSELAVLQGLVCKITLWLERITSCNPTFDFMITPLIAAHITLLCANQSYDRAQSVLSRLLSSETDSETSTPDRLFHLSEYLWSQLLQLRMTLPPFMRSKNSKGDPSFELSENISEANKIISNAVDALEVHPHHVGLFGDWNLVHAAALRGRIGPQLLEPFLEIVLAQHNSLSMRLSLEGCPLGLRHPNVGSALLPALPHALLLTGNSMIHLNLACCNLMILPFHFGRYFPILEVLNLESNSLKELPSSLVRMQCLAVLNIDSNEIEYLPSDFQFPRLTEMSAEGNRLRDLPESIRDCKELRVLNLSRNNFSLYDFASLATKLPKLHTLTSESVRGAQTSGSSNAAASCSLP